MKHISYRAFVSPYNYKTFDILKKNGKLRKIYAPEQKLKNILTTLNVIFQCIYKPHMSTHGYVQGKSVCTNAKNHVSKNYVYNIDLENFFPSIHQPRIWKRLQFPPFNLNGNKIKIANLISNLTCCTIEENVKKILPQGSPSSPILSNIICERLDRNLMELAKKNNIRYTRYVDDITFSSNENMFKKDSSFLKDLEMIINREGFLINQEKTRLQKKGYRQEVTGVIVNTKTNVSVKYIKTLRSLIFLIKKFGLIKANRIYCINFINKKIKKNEKPFLSLVIEGKLNYLKMLKGENDSTYLTLKNNYNEFIKKEYISIIEKEDTEMEEKNITQLHEPKKVVEILQKFTLKEPLKSTTHPENWNDKDYFQFMEEIKKEWSTLNFEYNQHLNKLRAKLNHFLLNKNLGSVDDDGYRISWGKNKIEFGWSSEDLATWCKNGNSPYKYEFGSKFITVKEGLKIKDFLEVIQYFKKEIEVRPDNNNFISILESVIHEKLGTDFEVNYINKQELGGAKFFVNVEWLEKGLKAIFDSIKSKESLSTKIEIEFIEDEDCNYYDLFIKHVDSKPLALSIKRFVNRLKLNEGSLSTIKELLYSVCDFSVNFTRDGKKYRVNILDGEELRESEINEEIEDFEYVLRFYL